jgi:hypothetical protein
MKALGKGSAESCKRADFEKIAKVNAALAAIRYADPASFTVATAVAQALAAAGLPDPSHDVAMMTISPDGPVEAMAWMTQAGREGTSSPIRFPASNAGSLVGLPSIAFGFRGPTMMFTLPPARGVPVALLLAQAQISVVPYVVVATCVASRARCLVLADGDGDIDTQWLQNP